MKKLTIVVFLSLVAASVMAQDQMAFQPMERSRHNFHLNVPSDVYLELEVYVDGELVGLNRGYVDPGTTQVDHGLTFDHYPHLDGQHVLLIVGWMREPGSNSLTTLVAQTVVDDLEYVYDSDISIYRDGSVEILIAYM